MGKTSDYYSIATSTSTDPQTVLMQRFLQDSAPRPHCSPFVRSPAHADAYGTEPVQAPTAGHRPLNLFHPGLEFARGLLLGATLSMLIWWVLALLVLKYL